MAVTGVDRRGLAAVVAVAALGLAGACTTKHEGDLLRKDVAELKGRLDQQDEQLKGKVGQLDESLAKATKLLTTSSADLGLEVQRLGEELIKLNGLVEAMRRDGEGFRRDQATLRTDLDALRTQASAKPAVDKDQLFAGAMAKIAGVAAAEARGELKGFVQRFPGDPRADDALLAIGDSLVREKQYEQALPEYQRLIDSFPTSDLVDDAFYAAGAAAQSNRWCTDARAYFGALVAKFPTSPRAKDAKARVETLKAKAKDKKVCTL